MKTKIVLAGILGMALLATAAPHVWTFKQGGTIEGDYFTSGTSAVVIRKDGTNCILKVTDLSSNDLAYVAKIKADQKQARLDAETRQMRQAGMIELTAKLVSNFPEKVDGRMNGPRSWMDAKFIMIDSSFLESPEFELGFQVEDKDGDVFDTCSVQKEFVGPNFMNGSNSTDTRTNPLVGVVMNLKRGDKVRLIGKVRPFGNAHGGHFIVERIGIIETAAEKKAREQAAEQATEQTAPPLDPQTGLPVIQK